MTPNPVTAAEEIVTEALTRLLDPCPRCRRITNLDEDGYRVCGRPGYGIGFSCGWRSRRPVER